MHASLNSIRIAPKKASLVAMMVRGMPVNDAIASLKRTHKRGARIIGELLRSAVANAEHNDKQRAEDLMIKTIIVNKADTLHRGVPIARGRWRPLKKFSSHITVTLGVISGKADTAETARKAGEKAPEPSQERKNPIKKATRTKKTSAIKSS